MVRFWRLALIVVGVAFLAAASDWQQVRFGPERTGADGHLDRPLKR